MHIATKLAMVASASPEIQTKRPECRFRTLYLDQLFDLFILAIWTAILLPYILRLVAVIESNLETLEY
jgi:hypothetical protein